MNKRIYKYGPINPAGLTFLMIPTGYKILTIKEQRPHEINLWAEVDSGMPQEQVEIQSIMTGGFVSNYPPPGKELHYLDTIIVAEGEFVFHVYHVKPQGAN